MCLGKLEALRKDFVCVCLFQYLHTMFYETGMFHDKLCNLKCLKFCARFTESHMKGIVYLLKHSSNLEALIIDFEPMEEDLAIVFKWVKSTSYNHDFKHLVCVPENNLKMCLLISSGFYFYFLRQSLISNVSGQPHEENATCLFNHLKMVEIRNFIG